MIMRKPMNLLISLVLAATVLQGASCQFPIVRPTSPPADTHVNETVPPALPANRDEVPYLDLAQEAYLRGDLTKALDFYYGQLEHYPESRGTDLALYRIAAIERDRGNRRASVEACRRLIRYFPDSRFTFEASVLLAVQLMDAEYFNEANEALDQAKSRITTHEERMRVGLLQAELAERKQSWSEAYLCLNDLYALADEKEKKAVEEKAKGLLKRLTRSELETLHQERPERSLGGHLLLELCRRFKESEEWGAADACYREFLDRYPLHDYAGEVQRILPQIELRRSAEFRRLGCVLPLTGDYAVYGRRVLNGAMLALNSFRPEERERMPQVFVRDSQGVPAVAADAIRELVEKENVVAILGPLTGDSSRVAGAVAEELQVPLITLSPADGITGIGHYVFRNSLTGRLQTRSLLRYAHGKLGLGKFAVLYPDNDYGRQMMEDFRKEASLLSLEVNKVESYSPNIRDFSQPVLNLIGERRWANYQEKVRRAKPGESVTLRLDFQGLFIPDDYRKILLVAPQLAFHDSEDIFLMGTNLWNSPTLAERGGQYLARSVFVADFFQDGEAESVAAFQKEYEQMFGEKGGFFAALGHDTMSLLIHALEEDRLPDRQSMRGNIEATSDFPGLTGVTSFLPGGEADKELQLLTVRHGKIVPLDSE